MAYRYESVRDFIILHYKLGERRDSKFWRQCAAMDIPDGLAHQIELFKQAGRVTILEPEGFLEPSWASLFLGLGVLPERHDPYIDLVDIEQIRRHMWGVRDSIRRAVGQYAHPYRIRCQGGGRSGCLMDAAAGPRGIRG